ncbi:ubiquitin-like domain-containing protein CIP73 isoform X1 [Phoenix dactylifera]|uniref:Ubiquitin-like domain-containing protein CIP73 isoform X1 n=1 Tax=Phoenix dactylifera TaxID=42345 RepID=A0A8B7BYG5_PHODC|nr:ubiquitin-like domain-containing protein CIP73 isoform X1 [Phoenix dactylifera]XP_008788012.2 ubiquitin-like domain-containing protein CIP73 isoform X1 [Phoenix dactylifera]XP_038989244.1 ubiquitin-like domain-containing protein CIP73 isoform X1 [Phoenix dactylifera]XP_038989245.1 ubiquitin-like domain-containing protein CIP73 isoform X1 [Phoenix dactylifera]XP_038989246.1 ubiquitin-like domain-containing protein CIP73 isoform X1 [Phoenix dactylifera]XP_038989247.1 ubiquitin-like domain-con
MADETLNEGTSSSQPTGESSESTIEINIKTLDSQIYTFRVNKDMSVPMLKEKVANAIGIPVEQQRLIFRGKVLKDNHLLSEYHLEDGHTLHLVVRQPVQAQPASGAASEDSARNSGNQGSDPTGNAPRNRAGQVSHSVVLGSVNISDQGEGMITDISRLIGAVLHSLGGGILSPAAGGAGNNSSAAVPPGPDTEGTQNTSSRSQPGNPVQPGFTVLNHPFQIPQFSPAGAFLRQRVIPDSLTTLSDFISRMELVLQNSGSQSSAPTNARDLPRSDDPSLNLRGLPTPEMLCSVVEQAQQLLRGSASSALSQFAANLERGRTSTDPLVRSQIQTEAMHVGTSMQHLGSMLLELGRTMMMLRMGQSPAESFVNAGPAVYISSTGPNPIMVQPFPQQMSSFLGVSPPPSVGGVSGPFGVGDPSRNINIHIHAGTSVAPGVSSAGTMASSEGINGGRQGVEQASQNVNGSGDSASVRGLPARTVVAAIPARSSAETAGHVLSVIYPVHMRSQASVSIPSASSQGSHPSMSGGTQPNAAIVIPRPSPESASIPAAVAQVNARVATASGQGSSSPSLQSTDTRDSQPISSGAQPITASSFSQTSSETDTIARLVTRIGTQIANALSGSAQGNNSSSLSMQQINATSATEGPQLGESVASSANIGDANESCPANSVHDTGDCDNSGSVESQVPDIGMTKGEGKQLQQEGHDLPDIAGPSGSFAIQKPSTSNSAGDLTICQPSDTPSSKSVDKSSEKNSESSATIHASRSSQDGESGRPAPLGLGLGGLQPKRRTRPAKPTKKDGISRDTPSADQNQQSVARGQQVLRSLVSQGSDTIGVNANGSSGPLSSVLGQVMNSMPLGEQGARQQVDAGDMMSHVLQSPAFGSLLTGVAERSGVGSPGDLRNMLEMCTQNPVIRNTMNDIVQQVDGQDQDLGGMLSGLGRGQGGIDFSRMIQQMLPAVSQVLGRGSTLSNPANGVRSEPQCNDGRTIGDDTLDSRNSQIDLCQARGRIEQHDSAENIFHAVLESAGNLFDGENNYEALVEELGNNVEFSKEYMEMLRRNIRQRLETESRPES